jgi:tripartite-type tricarboxylate transporter receptor subunit TctC
MLRGTAALDASHFIGRLAQLPFEPVRDFAPVSLLTAAPYVLVAGPATPAASLGELLALARGAVPPLAYGSAGNGTAGHLAMELLKAGAGVALVHVPYRGSPALLTDVMAGRVAVAFDNVLSSAPGIAAGSLRALAVSGAQRIAALPSVPTVAEAGLPGFEVTVWQGLLAPAGVPPPILALLGTELAAALATPAMRERLLALGVAPIGSDPAGFGRFLEAEFTRWGEVIRRAGVQVD